MNILKMNNELWHDDELMYVGRSRHALGLGNPWSHTNSRQARFWVATKGEALYKYREWLLKKLVPNYVSGLDFIGLDDWEKDYLQKVVNLSESIQKGETTSLGCWCIDVKNYLLVPEGIEKMPRGDTLQGLFTFERI